MREEAGSGEREETVPEQTDEEITPIDTSVSPLIQTTAPTLVPVPVPVCAQICWK